MGAGQQLAGAGNGGQDVAIGVPAPRVVPAWNALLRSNDKDAVLDADGFYKAIHPVDARVDLLLRSVIKGIPSAPEIGTSIRAFNLTPDFENQVKYEVRRVLKDEIAAKNIEVVAIDVTRPNPGAVVVEVRYRNLRVDARGSSDGSDRSQRVTLG